MFFEGPTRAARTGVVPEAPGSWPCLSGWIPRVMAMLGDTDQSRAVTHITPPTRHQLARQPPGGSTAVRREQKVALHSLGVGSGTAGVAGPLPEQVTAHERSERSSACQWRDHSDAPPGARVVGAPEPSIPPSRSRSRMVGATTKYRSLSAGYRRLTLGRPTPSRTATGASPAAHRSSLSGGGAVTPTDGNLGVSPPRRYGEASASSYRLERHPVTGGMTLRC